MGRIRVKNFASHGRKILEGLAQEFRIFHFRDGSSRASHGDFPLRGEEASYTVVCND